MVHGRSLRRDWSRKSSDDAPRIIYVNDKIVHDPELPPHSRFATCTSMARQPEDFTDVERIVRYRRRGFKDLMASDDFSGFSPALVACLA